MPAAEPAIHPILDVAVSRRMFGLWPFIALMAGSVGIAVPLAILRAPTALLSGANIVAIFVGMSVVDWVRRRRIRRRLARFEAAPTAAGDDVIANAAEIVRQYPDGMALGSSGFHPRSGVALDVAGALARIGWIGRSFRLAGHPEKLDAVPPPFDAPFEPTPLSQSSPAFRALRNDDRDALKRWWANVDEQFMMHGGERQRKLLKAAMVVGWVTLLFMLGKLAIDLASGRRPPELSMFAVLLPIVLVGWLIQSWRQEQWFAVPGGLLIRCSGMFESRWRLELLRREECVLVYWRELYTLAVARADGVGFSKLRVRSDEAEVALRAWQSPVPPPPIEQFTDFAD